MCDLSCEYSVKMTTTMHAASRGQGHPHHLESPPPAGATQKTGKISLAKIRWKMLSKALHEGKVFQSDVQEGSVRQFCTFGLLHHVPLEESDDPMLATDPKGKWFECSCIEEAALRIRIRLLSDRLTIEDLKGFDNTGNVCIWPSEEVLAYYCMKNKELFLNKSVCELGGGMTCLGGLVVAATSDAMEVYLTDGNERAIQNIKAIVEQNRMLFGSTHVTMRRLRWDQEEDLADLMLKFDVVICADCLYFDEGRIPLANTIWKILKESGIAVILAPTRGKTFQQFVDVAASRFHVEQIMAYDTFVWELHEKLQKRLSGVYNKNLHYPQMIILRKQQS